MAGEELFKEFESKIVEAEKAVWSADHLIGVILPVVKDTKLLIKALEFIHGAMVDTITVVLKSEYLHKRVSLTKDQGKNLEIFFSKCADRYGLNELEKSKVREIIDLGKRHKQSGFEFSKKGRVIILDDNLGYVQLSVDDLKGLIRASRRLVGAAKVGVCA